MATRPSAGTHFTGDFLLSDFGNYFPLRSLWVHLSSSGSLRTSRFLPHVSHNGSSNFSNSDNTSIIQNLLCWVRGDEHQRLCGGLPALPVRRLFEPGWEHQLPSHVSRLERLSAHATEVYGRLLLPNDFLFKVDTASMRESLEVRVPLFENGSCLPSVSRCRMFLRPGVKTANACCAESLKNGFRHRLSLDLSRGSEYLSIDGSRLRSKRVCGRRCWEGQPACLTSSTSTATVPSWKRFVISGRPPAYIGRDYLNGP